MEFKKLVYVVENRVAKIMMDYAPNLNALDEAMASELIKALKKAEVDDNVKVVMIGSNSNNFSAGGDIGAMYQSFKKKDDSVVGLLDAVCELPLVIKKLPKPVVAVVRGAAAGAGISLAIACDFVLASENAKFIEAFVGLGMIPDTGGIYVLSRLVGVMRASELVFSGRPVGAVEAKEIGMITDVYPDDQLETAAAKLLGRLAMGPSLSFKFMKELMYEAEFKGFEAYMELERHAQFTCSQSSDALEGMEAFVQRRHPKFK